MRVFATIVALATAAQALCGNAQGDENVAYGVPRGSDQVVLREGYALGYCEEWELPLWVSYRLTDNEVTNNVVQRLSKFVEDPAIYTGSATPADYRGSGYDRGHMAPAADMAWSTNAMAECFCLSNVVPQEHGNNAGIWLCIERAVRAFALNEGSVYVVTGPIVTNESPRRIGKSGVAVPDGLYKIVLDDEYGHEKAIAFMVSNEDVEGVASNYVCTVDDVETVTGLDFFSEIDEDDQERIESSVDAGAWRWER